MAPLGHVAPVDVSMEGVMLWIQQKIGLQVWVWQLKALLSWSVEPNMEEI